MGREASCQCKWRDEQAFCKVLLEPRELIVRGAIRRRVPLSSLADVSVQGECLTFRVHEDQVTLTLGEELAGRWAKTIATPPPSLAKKLGIAPETSILVIGAIESEELQAALAEARAQPDKHFDLALACVHTLHQLEHAIQAYLRSQTTAPFWIIYPKGAGRELSENSVRNALRQRNFIDTKVASVSEELTALRFIQRA